ncbi:hypothetical protein [Marinitenerispora sediminis]|uniref:Uncharacterized protein n=1 Tax=Marinitenerispora sediminis TaxID=1931232 RepID=A0A368T637_9ACTN|nr:hypothetical protein [Marinitenerispora sediminis]RCV50497.1 hypothetical protein DEF28_17985 [Marinitenerispora sediminis]RCV55478.1 hypothetical protein DEF23_14275 [Marinitenerispora sediminis]RCV59110.1 hypothetical protein DEF24_10960 [Marinitenerispora sediminis]
MLILNSEVFESFLAVRGADHGTVVSIGSGVASPVRGGAGIGAERGSQRVGGGMVSGAAAGGSSPIDGPLVKRQYRRLWTESVLAGTPRPSGAVGMCPRSSPA